MQLTVKELFPGDTLDLENDSVADPGHDSVRYRTALCLVEAIVYRRDGSVTVYFANAPRKKFPSAHEAVCILPRTHRVDHFVLLDLHRSDGGAWQPIARFTTAFKAGAYVGKIAPDGGPSRGLAVLPE